jgi:hypothetical protein
MLILKIVCLILSLPLLAAAVPTPVSISVLSSDAKFVGSSMGAMQVNIRDVLTGELLASGKTLGSTGDTGLIMADERSRDEVIRTDGSARFDTELELDRPTEVSIEAFGPLAQLQSAATVSETRVLLPGKNYADGNGIILSLPGMVVDVLKPRAHLKTAQGTELKIEANVAKMCGCPVGETTPWPVDRYEVEVIIYAAGGERLQSLPLDYAGSNSLFHAHLPDLPAGAYEFVVTAFDPKSKDSGVDSTTVIFQ